MDEEAEKTAVMRRHFRRGYFLVLAAPFFWQLPILLGLSVAYPIQAVFRPLLLGFGAMMVTGLWLTGESPRARLGLDGGILLLAFGWMAVVFLWHRQVLEEAGPVLQRAAIAWLLFYPLGSVLDAEEERMGLRVVAGCWTAVMALLAGIGILCAATGTALENLSGNLAFGMLGHRLHLGIWTTSTSENLLTGWLMAGVGVMLCPRRRWMYGAAMAEMLLAMALTDGRNGMLCMGISVGAAVLAVLWKRFEKKKLLAICTVGIAAACIPAVYLGCIQLQRGFPNTYDQVRSLRRAVIEPFLAESPPEPAAVEAAAVADTHRRIDRTLNGRRAIWEGAIGVLAENADGILWVGCPGSRCLETMHKYRADFPEADHLHNVYLQGVCEYGLLAGGLILAFLTVFAISGWKLLFSQDVSDWERFVPIPAGVILISELADAFTRFGQDNAVLYVLFLFLGLSISHARKSDNS